MDRLAQHCQRTLARRRPACATLGDLEDALRRDRIATTRSVLVRSIRIAERVVPLDPWRGPNRGIARSAEGPWVVLAPAGHADPSEVPGAESTPASAPRPGAPGRPDPAEDRIDRALRVIGSGGDADSPVALARWVRLFDEGTRMVDRVRRLARVRVLEDAPLLRRGRAVGPASGRPIEEEGAPLPVGVDGAEADAEALDLVA